MRGPARGATIRAMNPAAAPQDREKENAQSAASGELSWHFNPWLADWRRPALALGLELLVAALAGYTFTTPDWWPQALGWGGISLALLLAMTTTIYLPVRYRLDQQGVTTYFIGTPTFRKWQHYRNFYAHEKLVHLTTMPKPSRLDPFRGHSLQFAGNRAEVLAFIREHMPHRGTAPQ